MAQETRTKISIALDEARLSETSLDVRSHLGLALCVAHEAATHCLRAVHDHQIEVLRQRARASESEGATHGA